LIEGEVALSVFRGQTLVLALAQSWRDTCPETLTRLRAELRGLDAALLLVSPDELCVFRPGDALQARMEVGKASKSALERLMQAHGVEERALSAGAITLVIVDGGGAVRWSETVKAVEQPLDALLEAISGAVRRLQARRPSPLGSSRRDLVLASLVVSFAVIFGSGYRPPRPDTHKTLATNAVHERDVVLQFNAESGTI
jgi:hypothetical protein